MMTATEKMRNTKNMLTIGSVLSLFVFGLFDSLKGSTISALLDELKFTYSLGGAIVMGQYAGYFAATFLAGRMLDYFGHKMTLIFAGVCMLAGVMGYAAFSSILLLLVSIFLIGMGLGTLELSGSNIITVYYPEKKGRYLNILTAMAGIGAILSPMIVSILFHEGFSWRRVYYSGMLVLLPVTVYFTLMKSPPAHRNAHSENFTASNKAAKTQTSLFRNDFLSMYIVNFLYMAAEMGIATWIVEFYAKEGKFFSENSTKFLTLFYIGMTLGRMAGSVFVDKLGRRNSVLFASAAAFICILTGIFGPSSLKGCVAVSGVFCSIIFPTATAVISSFPEGTSGRIQGFYFACGGLGGMVGPWIMGIASDCCTIKWGMVLGSTFLAGISMLCFRFSN
jgi:FHS family glucose/mannose:H+ symporter-like MFS transporter